MRFLKVENFPWGTIDTLEDRSLPHGASSRSLNWLTKIDKIELRGGNTPFGNEVAGAGKITGFYIAKMSDGTLVPFRTRGKKLEYFKISTSTWTEIGTNVLGTDADGKDIAFAEYHSLAGDQLFINSPKGPLLKIMLANPGSYADMYAAAKNYKGYIKIKQNRMFLWARIKDKTGVYLSFIDEQNFTTVSTEVLGSGDGSEKTFAGTLAFKAGGAKRTCFAIEGGDSVETFIDNYDGTLTGDAGGTGTINYMTGAISVTFNAAVGNGTNVTIDYQWEDSTNGGVCDFTYSGTRVAGEGDVFRQDDGGPLMNIFSYENVEYCVHEKKTWVLTLSDDDTGATNYIYREKIGMPYWRAGVATDSGIYVIDDTDKKDPHLRLITIPRLSDKAIPISVSKAIKYKNKKIGIDLSSYLFNKAVVFQWGDFILIACRTSAITENNRLIVYNKIQRTFDVTDLWASTLAEYEGTLLGGDPFLNNVYTLFSGFDDDDSLILNYWEGNSTDFGEKGLKGYKKQILQGQIGPDQVIEVYAATDGGSFVHIGDIEGSGGYVDRGQSVAVGTLTMGSREVGGGGEGIIAYNYQLELDFSQGKFERVKLRFEAVGLGYASISTYIYNDIRIKSRRIPAKYR